MRMGELADQSRINPKTIRYDEDLGLVPPASCTSSGYRDCSDHDAARPAVLRCRVAPCRDGSTTVTNRTPDQWR